MHDPFVEKYGVTNPINSEKLTDILSGIYNSGFSMGVILGPFIASYITIGVGYRLQADIFAYFGIAFGILHLLVVYLPMRLAKSKENRKAKG